MWLHYCEVSVFEKNDCTFNIYEFQAHAERSTLEEVSSLRDIFCAKKLSVRHVSAPRDDDDGARIVSELVEVVLFESVMFNM